MPFGLTLGLPRRGQFSGAGDRFEQTADGRLPEAGRPRSRTNTDSPSPTIDRATQERRLPVPAARQRRLGLWVPQTRAPPVTSGFVKYDSLASYDT
jgi:hypothetical protein